MFANAGFTMVELLMVTAIVGILVLLAIPGYARVKNIAKTARAEAEIRELEKGITSYAIDHGELPASLEAIGRANALDPWGREYVYAQSPRLRDTLTFLLNQDFDLYSTGADGLTDEGDINDSSCRDDIVRGGDGGYVGRATIYQSL